MKKILPILLLLLAINVANAQDNEGLKKHYLKIYDQGLAYNDVSAAINALHGYLAIDRITAFY